MKKLVGRVVGKLDSDEIVLEMAVWSCITVKYCKKMGSACSFSMNQCAWMGYEEERRWGVQALLDKMSYIFVVCYLGSFD